MTILSMALGWASPRFRTLSDWLVEYEKIIALRRYSAQTIKNRKISVNHVRRLLGDKPLRSIQPQHLTVAVREFLPHTPTMAQKVLDEMRDIFREAAANGWCDKNPADFVRRPPAPVRRKRLDMETWTKMRVAAAASRIKWTEPMLLLALVTGQRRSDLWKMRFDDVRDGYLYIEQQKKAGKPHGARIRLPLELRLDVIGMTLGDVIEFCRTYTKPGPTMLRKRDGGQLARPDMLSYRFEDTIVPLGTWEEGERPSLHECRSLSERLYREQGIDTKTLLGHKNQQMTDKYNDERDLNAHVYKPLVLVPKSAVANESAAVLAA